MGEFAWLEEEDGPFGAAVRRLGDALGSLEARVSARLAAAPVADPHLLSAANAENARLCAELAAAKAREAALEEVAAEASAALGRAADEVRAALAAEEP